MAGALVPTEISSGNDMLAVAVRRLEQRSEGDRRKVLRLERRLEDSVQIPTAEGRWAELEGYVDGLADTLHALVRHAEDSNSAHHTPRILSEEIGVSTFCQPPRVEMTQSMTMALDRSQQRHAERLRHSEQTLGSLGERVIAVEAQLNERMSDQLAVLLARLDALETHKLESHQLQQQTGMHVLSSHRSVPPLPGHPATVLLDTPAVLLDSPTPVRTSGAKHAQVDVRQHMVNNALQDLAMQVDRIAESVVGLSSRLSETERGNKCLAELGSCTAELGARVVKLEHVAGPHAEIHALVERLGTQTESLLKQDLSSQLQDVQSEVRCLVDVHEMHVRISQVEKMATQAAPKLAGDAGRVCSDSEVFSLTGPTMHEAGSETRLEQVGAQVVDLASRMQDLELGQQDAAELQKVREQVSGVGEQVLRLLVRLQNVEHGLGSASERRELRDELAESHASRADLAEAECGLEHLAEAFSRVCSELAELRGRVDAVEMEQRVDVAELRGLVDVAQLGTEEVRARSGNSQEELRVVFEAMGRQVASIEVRAEGLEGQITGYRSQIIDLASSVGHTSHDVEGLEWVQDLKGEVDKMRLQYSSAHAALDIERKSAISVLKEHVKDELDRITQQNASTHSSLELQHDSALAELHETARKLRDEFGNVLEGSAGTEERITALADLVGKLHTLVEQAHADLEQFACLQGQHHEGLNLRLEKVEADQFMEAAELRELIAGGSKELCEQICFLREHHADASLATKVDHSSDMVELREQISKLNEKHAVVTLPTSVDHGSDIKDLREQLSLLSDRHDDVTLPPNVDHSNDMKDLREQVSLLNEKHADAAEVMLSQNADHSSDIRELQEHISLLCDKHADVTLAANPDHSSDIKELRVQMSQLREQHADVSAIQELQVQISLLNDKYADVTLPPIVDHSRDIKELREQMSLLQEQHTDATLSPHVDHISDIKKLRDQVSLLNDRNADVTLPPHVDHSRDIKELREQISFFNEKHADVTLSQNAQHSSDIKELRAQMSLLNGRHTDVTLPPNIDHGRDIKALSAQLSLLNEKNADVTLSQNAHHSSDIKEVREQISVLNNRLVDVMLPPIGDHNSEIQEMREQLSLLKQQHTDVKLSVNVDHSSDIKMLHDQVCLLSDRHAGVTPTPNVDHSSDIKELREQISLLRDKHAAATLLPNVGHSCDIQEGQDLISAAGATSSWDIAIRRGVGSQFSNGEEVVETNSEQDEFMDRGQLARELRQAKTSAAHRASLDEYRAEALDAVDSRVSAVSERLADTCERVLDVERGFAVAGRNSSMLRARFDRLEGGIEDRVGILVKDVSEIAERQLALERGLLAAVAHGSALSGGGGARARLELQAHLSKLPAAPSHFRLVDAPSLPPPSVSLPASEPCLAASLPRVHYHMDEVPGGTSRGNVPQTC